MIMLARLVVLVLVAYGAGHIAHTHGHRADIRTGPSGIKRPRSDTRCSWGASSISGTFVNGRFRVSHGPTVTGCAP